MHKIIIAIISFIFLSIQSAYSMDLNVKSIDKDLGEAVLIDMDTGDEWIVFEEDDIGGWVVTEIKEHSVTIRKEAEGDMPYGIVRKLTLPNKISVVPVQ